MLRDPGMAGATLTKAQAAAMVAAAGNESAGAMMAFGAMNMASNAGGVNASQLYGMAAQNQPTPTPPSQGGGGMKAPTATTSTEQWSCSCGTAGNTGKFCMECGNKSPQDLGWTCTCGSINKGNFCIECGNKKPIAALLYKCDKCGWEPDEPSNPPKFCPECGDIFNENDVIS